MKARFAVPGFQILVLAAVMGCASSAGEVSRAGAGLSQPLDELGGADDARVLELVEAILQPEEAGEAAERGICLAGSDGSGRSCYARCSDGGWCQVGAPRGARSSP